MSPTTNGSQVQLAAQPMDHVLYWTISQLLKVGPQLVSLQLCARYYADHPRGGPDWGLRFQVQLLFPK